MSRKPSAIQQSVLSEKNRCLFSTVDGRKCRMYRAKNRKSFCLLHAQQEEQLLDAEELIGPVEEYQTAICANRALGCLFNPVAQKRISRQAGALLAFIGQMMLHGIGSSVKDEFIRISSDTRPSQWNTNVRRAAEILSNDYSRHTEKAPDEEPDEYPEEEPAVTRANTPLEALNPLP